jgi:hypothetical protein
VRTIATHDVAATNAHRRSDDMRTFLAAAIAAPTYVEFREAEAVFRRDHGILQLTDKLRPRILVEERRIEAGYASYAAARAKARRIARKEKLAAAQIAAAMDALHEIPTNPHTEESKMGLRNNPRIRALPDAPVPEVITNTIARAGNFEAIDTGEAVEILLVDGKTLTSIQIVDRDTPIAQLEATLAALVTLEAELQPRPRRVERGETIALAGNTIIANHWRFLAIATTGAEIHVGVRLGSRLHLLGLLDPGTDHATVNQLVGLMAAAHRYPQAVS